jgi:hypothetical protein
MATRLPKASRCRAKTHRLTPVRISLCCFFNLELKCDRQVHIDGAYWIPNVIPGVDGARKVHGLCVKSEEGGQETIESDGEVIRGFPDHTDVKG